MSATHDLLRTIRRTRGRLESQLQKPPEKREVQLPDEQLRRLVRIAREHERAAEEVLA